MSSNENVSGAGNKVLSVDPHSFLYRLVAGLAGFTMIALGTGPLVRGEIAYSNWFGGMVFAPFAVLFGILTIYCAIFKPNWLAVKRAGRTDRRR